MANVLRRHHLGTARQRVAALASLTAAESGQVTDAALEGPFGFCLYASTPRSGAGYRLAMVPECVDATRFEEHPPRG